MTRYCNLFTICLFLAIFPLDALVIRRPVTPKFKKVYHKNKRHRRAQTHYINLEDNPYLPKNEHRHLNEKHHYYPMKREFSITHTLHLADFFIVIVAVFIGILIAEFIKPLFSGSSSKGGYEPPMPTSYGSYGGFRARKLTDDNNKNRLLKSISSKIHRGQSKVASYINRVLFNKHNVYIPKNKLFKEVVKVRKYFDNSGMSLPDKLSERNLYQITRNVFWNLHRYNVDRKKHLAVKAIRTLYSHRKSLFNTFIDSIKGV